MSYGETLIMHLARARYKSYNSRRLSQHVPITQCYLEAYKAVLGVELANTPTTNPTGDISLSYFRARAYDLLTDYTRLDFFYFLFGESPVSVSYDPGTDQSTVRFDHSTAPRLMGVSGSGPYVVVGGAIPFLLSLKLTTMGVCTDVQLSRANISTAQGGYLVTGTKLSFVCPALPVVSYGL